MKLDIKKNLQDAVQSIVTVFRIILLIAALSLMDNGLP